MDDDKPIFRPAAGATRKTRTTWVNLCLIAALVVCVFVVPPLLSANAQSATWERWQPLEGAVDIGGPRSDGNLVVMAAGRLFLVSPDGATAPFATGADGFSGPADAEPYFVVAPALPPQTVGCNFVRDEIFILDLGSPTGVIRVDAAGRASRFATIPNVDFLSGIAFDTTGRFGYALLATGQQQDRTSVVAIDCQGGVTIVTDTGPAMEGGVVVAPVGFGPYGGDLIAPDELTGQIWAISPDGSTRLVAVPDLPTGGDTGVESMGFVPPGFNNGGFAYLADRGTPDNPFPGTDSILRLSSQTLGAAGVQGGDLLVATEGDGLTVAIHCEATCTARRIAEGPVGGHIEGHIVLVSGR
jgi:hypothetical protein